MIIEIYMQDGGHFSLIEYVDYTSVLLHECELNRPYAFTCDLVLHIVYWAGLLQLSQTVTRVWAELARELADTLILPHDVVTFAKFVRLNTAKILSTYNELLISGGLQAQMSEYIHVDNMLADCRLPCDLFSVMEAVHGCKYDSLRGNPCCYMLLHAVTKNMSACILYVN